MHIHHQVLRAQNPRYLIGLFLRLHRTIYIRTSHLMWCNWTFILTLTINESVIGSPDAWVLGSETYWKSTVVFVWKDIDDGRHSDLWVGWLLSLGSANFALVGYQAESKVFCQGVWRFCLGFLWGILFSNCVDILGRTPWKFTRWWECEK